MLKCNQTSHTRNSFVSLIIFLGNNLKGNWIDIVAELPQCASQNEIFWWQCETHYVELVSRHCSCNLEQLQIFVHGYPRYIWWCKLLYIGVKHIFFDKKYITRLNGFSTNNHLLINGGHCSWEISFCTNYLSYAEHWICYT